MNTPARAGAQPGPLETLRFAGAVVLVGLVVAAAATVDPWLLVMLAGLAVALYAWYQRPAEFGFLA